MPTPFYHLSVAVDLLALPALPKGVRRFLNAEKSAFYLGKTAPDVQVMTGQRREYTHFYKIPMTDPTPAWERLVETYPELGNAANLQASQAAFLAGYFCHLQADQRWLVEIFDPHFGPGQSWETFSRRLTVHNILRAYYDLHLVNELPKDTAAVLQGAAIRKWLPFVADRDLQAWCEFLASQLLPGAQIQTVEVFAARQGLAVETFNQVLLSEEQMETEVFSKIPRRTLGRYRRRLLDENADFLAHYLSGL